MALFRVTTHIEAPPERVWDLLVDWEGSASWMVDATTVEVLGERREGVGTRIRAVTTIAGVAITDAMTVTAWVPGRLIQVEHTGWPIRGIAWFEIAPDGGGTRLEWAEELDPPLGPFGEMGARVLKGQIERILRKSLVMLRKTAERPPAQAGIRRKGDESSGR